jgi:hypothetical protein
MRMQECKHISDTQPLYALSTLQIFETYACRWCVNVSMLQLQWVQARVFYRKRIITELGYLESNVGVVNFVVQWCSDFWLKFIKNIGKENSVCL